MNELLKVDNISKQYVNNAARAVDQVSFIVKKQEIFALIGESGSGKSTLAKIISKLIYPTEGTVYFSGQDIYSLTSLQDKNLRRKMQIVFQDTYAALNQYMTVEEIITEPLFIFKMKANVESILDMVGLESALKDRHPRELSGGQCRRVNLARALALNPELLIADEITSGLDLTVQAGLLNLILDLQKNLGIAFVFISHDLDVVEHIADRVGVMSEGKLIEIGDTSEVFDNPKHEYVKKLIRFSRFIS